MLPKSNFAVSEPPLVSRLPGRRVALRATTARICHAERPGSFQAVGQDRRCQTKRKAGGAGDHALLVQH